MSSRVRVFVAFALVACGAAPACSKEHDAPRPVALHDSVTVTPAQERHVEVVAAALDTTGVVFDTTGRVTYNEDAVARPAAPVSGRVMELRARVGDEVKAQQVLAVIHSPEVASAEADLAQDQARRVQAEQAFARSQRLVESGAGSAREMEEAHAALSQAKAAEEKDMATLRAVGGGAKLANPVYLLRAPIAGTVTERSVSLGAGVRSDEATPLFVVADLSRVWVIVDVFEQDLALVAKGSAVEVRVPAYPDRVFEGSVEYIASALDPGSRAAKVRITLPNPERVLLPEMFARVTVRAKPQGLVSVPTGAVLSKGDKTYVFIETSARQYVPRPVVLGSRSGGTIQIRSGVKEAERVVTRGGLLLDAEMNERL